MGSNSDKTIEGNSREHEQWGLLFKERLQNVVGEVS